MHAAVTLALARLVFEPSSPQFVLTEDAVLLVQREQANLGCAGGDAGVDAGVDAGMDAGVDAGAGDAGVDAGCEPILGDAVTLIMRPRFATDGTGGRFALLFVTPSRPIVETVADPFAELALLTAPRTETHVTEIPDATLGKRCNDSGGCGFGAVSTSPAPSFDPPDLGDASPGDGPPVVESVGPYEIVRVQPADTAELQALLTSLDYTVQAADVTALAPYITAGYTVVAVRVAVDGGNALSPISMTWAGSELRLPLALGADSADGLTTYIAGNQRYEFPLSDVRYAKYTVGGETQFLTRMVLGPIESESPDTDPVAIPAGSAEFEDIHIIEETKHVPVSNCYDDVDVGCCQAGNPRGDFGVLVGIVLLVLRRKRATASR